MPPPADPRSDLELVSALNAGDASAFDALYFRHRDWVVRLAAHFAGNDADALDVLQETFSYLLRKFPGFRLTASMTTFLYPVVKHLALAAKKKTMRLVADDIALDSAPDRESADPKGSRPELAEVLASLPETHREVLLMRFVDGLSLAEIAEALEIPVGTVKSRLHNGLSLLREDPRAKHYFNPT
ncbi:MAG TPA: sigma-70 family RNA polymerase sigma factor [Roseimicrobium sp.]|nr:sigma-70 family RNA polymerase sigma factor [Roseimicrobium sp.]